MKIISCFLVYLFTVLQFAYAAEPLEVVGMTSSSDCGPMSHEVNLDPGDSSIQCLRVYFKDFAVSTSKVESVQRNCHMMAKLRIPANTQFRASEAIAEGAYRLDGLAYGGLNLSYELSATKALGQWFEGFRPFSMGDFNFTTKVESQAFTACYPYETEIELTSDLHAFIDQRGVGQSLVSLDETGKRLSWNWKLQPCSVDLFATPFISYYQMSFNSRRYQALMRISGDRGNYETNEGIVGRLFNIRRTEGGTVATGEWQGGNAHGTFRFKILDVRTGQFEGEWRDSLGYVGRWWGEYE